MSYQSIVSDETKSKRVSLAKQRKLHLYAEIYRDICGILKVLLPSDKALEINLKIKSIMYNLIELATKKRPDKF